MAQVTAQQGGAFAGWVSRVQGAAGRQQVPSSGGRRRAIACLGWERALMCFPPTFRSLSCLWLPPCANRALAVGHKALLLS